MENADRRGASYEEMTTVDEKIDRLADKLQEFANRSAAGGGPKAKLAEPLAEDAAFVRKLKPSLIMARARGKSARVAEPPPSPRVPSPGRARRPTDGSAKGPNPWLVAGVCFAAGIALAKWIDWRGHARPRD